MKICVLIKQVPSEDSPIIVGNNRKSINLESLNLVSNEPDTYALEEALQLKEKNNGEVTVCTLGPESSRQVLKDALAKGADKGIFISDDGIENKNPINTAKIIAEFIKDEKFDLILSGLQSNDQGFAQIGLLVAEYLNTSHASLVMGTEIIDENAIKVKLELENGWFQWSELDFPASLTIQSGINTPRYATLPGIMSVKNKKVDEFSKNDISFELNDNGYTVSEIFQPAKSKETLIIEGDVSDMTDELVDVLKNKIKVI